MRRLFHRRSGCIAERRIVAGIAGHRGRPAGARDSPCDGRTSAFFRRITSPLGRTGLPGAIRIVARVTIRRSVGRFGGPVLRERHAGGRRRRRSAVRRRVDGRESVRADPHSRRGDRCARQHRVGCDRARAVRDRRDHRRLAGAARSDRGGQGRPVRRRPGRRLVPRAGERRAPDDRPRQRRIAAGDLYAARGREPEHARTHGVRSRGRRAARRLPPAERSHHRGAVRAVARSDYRADRRSRDDRGRRPRRSQPKEARQSPTASSRPRAWRPAPKAGTSSC